MNDPTSWRQPTLPCPDPDCDGTAEPETDGPHAYHACTRCGYEFGWTRATTQPVKSDGSCPVGIPEGIRRAASAPAQQALANSRGLPLLQIGKRPPHAPPA